MPELLLELFSEEIPARMQAGAARDLERMAAERFKAQELGYDRLQTFAGPRRLTLVIDGLPAAQADRNEELKGPKASAPPQALEGFLRKTGLTREALTERDGVLYAQIARTGRPTPEIAAEIVGEICHAFPWPKSMRSGVSAFRWVRPLKRVLFLFDGQVVPFEIDGITSGDLTQGHRFMGSKGAPFAVRDFAVYRAKLAAEFVEIDAAARKAKLLDTSQLPFDGLELVPDEGLAEEVAGLVEHPIPTLGHMDPAFLDLPPEVIRTSMRTHQKYFAVRRPGEAGLAPNFVVVANIEASDGGATIAQGNAKVLSARLSDARFFWDEDRKPGAFERWNDKLKGVTFHAKLGTMAERVERISALAREIAPAVGADPDLAERAARLCKADLASLMVGEFPELQGVMGGYYAREMLSAGASFETPSAPQDDEGGGLHDGRENQGVPNGRHAEEARSAVSKHALTAEQADAVADAVRDHYKPVGPSDSVPTAPVTVAVALADKLDTLRSFFAISEQPTGSRDPYALRRASLGVIRLILLSKVRLGLRDVLAGAESVTVGWRATLATLLVGSAETISTMAKVDSREIGLRANLLASDLLDFFADRLKVQLRDEGRRHDLVDAVFELGDDDLVRIVDKVEALSGFLATDDGANLLAGYKRAANILRAEAKKNADERIEGAPAPHPAAAPEERELQSTLARVTTELEPLLAAEDFTAAMAALAKLRAPVDAFFDKVLVNDPDPEVRLNRLRLLTAIQDAANRVADFSLIQS